MGGFDSEFIFDAGSNQSEIDSLFGDDSTKENSNPSEGNNNDGNDKEETVDQENVADDGIVEEKDIDSLFDSQESVGNEEKNVKEDTKQSKDVGNSPNALYSSVAKVLKDSGVYPNITDEDLDSIKSAEDMVKMFAKQKELEMDETTKRVNDALSYGMQPKEIQQYESTLRYLNSITNEMLEAEDEKGDDLRKRILYQDYKNRGYSDEKATRVLKRIFDSGQDIEDAKDALQSNLDYFTDKYNDTVKTYKEKQQEKINLRNKEIADLNKSIMDNPKIFDDIEVDNNTRKKIIDNISKPTFKDKDTGEYYTALEQFERENHNDFMKYVGFFFTITDGFKSLNKIVNQKVSKAMEKKHQDLETLLQNMPKNSDGSLKLVAMDDNNSSVIGKKGKFIF